MTEAAFMEIREARAGRKPLGAHLLHIAIRHRYQLYEHLRATNTNNAPLYAPVPYSYAGV